MIAWLAASDGSYDHRLGIGAWGVALCRGIRRDGSLHGLQSRSGGVPAEAALSPHACEAFAALQTLRWVRKLGGRELALGSDCDGLAAMIEGRPRPDVADAVLADLVAVSRTLGWTVVASGGRDRVAGAFQALHQRCHRAALATLRRMRSTAGAD